jgi:Ca-activated chloride channel family protein
LRQVIDPHLLEHLQVRQSRQRRVRPIETLLVFWLLACLALAGPSWTRQASPFAGEEAGLVVLLKVSRTMTAGDVQPSRLQRAKFKLHDLLELRGNAPSALVVYSGSAHLVVPLTRDERILTTMIEDLEPEMMPVEGDALSVAIDRADGLLQRAGIAGSILVIADNVASAEKMREREALYPVQFHAIKPVSSPLDPGMQQVARALSARITPMSVDASDVEAIARRAESDLRASLESEGGDRWKDSGYALLPLLALCGLLWSRKGWVVQ